MNKKKQVFYVTFQIRYVTKNKPLKIAVKAFCYEDAREIAADAYSIDGINYLRINRCGRVSKDYEKLSISEYRKRF